MLKHYTRQIFGLIVSILITISINAQDFVGVYGSNTPFFSSTNQMAKNGAFGDYDNDNDLDFILIGESSYIPTRIYNNNGQGGFISVLTNLPYFTNGEVKWFDFNNDGNLDIIFWNQTPTVRQIKIYKNNGPPNYSFSQIPFTPGLNLDFYGVDVTDLNRNGKYDIITLGDNNRNRLFENRYADSSIFVLDSASISSTVQMSCALWDISIMDANKDGYNDVFVKYFNNIQASILIGQEQKPMLQPIQYNNTPGTVPNIPPIDFYGTGFFHYILRTNAAIPMHSIFRILNNTTSFMDTISISGTIIGAFDYNNDGSVDLLTSNANFYSNNGSANFSLDTSYNLNFKTPIIADFDNDNDLDFYSNNNIYKNLNSTPNTPPSAPLTMWTTIDSSKVIFHWHKATDVETPQASLSYNLMVGTSPKGIDITSPLADTATGFRRVVELGNAQLNNFYILDKSNFNIGDTIYWSVQTIDNGFGFSPFSQENRTIICNRLDAPLFDSICANDSILWRGNYYSSAGKYFQSYATSTQCDSSFALDLKLNPTYLDLEVTDICSGSTYSWKGTTYYLPGTYNIPHYTTEGCDSIERLVLNVRPSHTTLLSKDICMGDSLLFATNYLSTSGIYIDSLVTNYSCDSIIHLTLTVSPGDTSIMQSGDTLFAVQQNAFYRWWNCDKQQFVYGANQSYFIPYEDGHYAAEITANGCSYLTQCYEITGLSLDDNGINNLEIYLMPNPSDGEFYLEFTAPGKQEYQIVIFDALGKEVYNQQVLFENYQKLKLNLKPEGSGVYQLRVVSENDLITRRFIIR